MDTNQGVEHRAPTHDGAHAIGNGQSDELYASRNTLLLTSIRWDVYCRF